MEYIVKEVKNSSIVVEFKDGSWAEVPVANGMTLGEVDEAVLSFAPKGVLNDSTLTGLIGQVRNAQKAAPVEVPEITEVEAVNNDWELDIESQFQKTVDAVATEVLARLKAEG
jgi:hypothetical protein